MHSQLGTLLLEDILCLNPILCSRFQLTKNPDVSIATKSLPLYSRPKLKRKQYQSSKSKENSLKSINKENNIKH